MTMSIQPIQDFLSSLSTKGYYIWDNFFDRKEIQAIKEAIPDQLNDAKIGHKATLQGNKTIRGDQTVWLDAAFGPAIVHYLEKMDEIRQRLNREFYLGLRDFETHYCRYQEGAFYKKHIDNPQGESRRKITTVLYLNEHWQKGDGGELVLYNMAQEPLLTVEPLAGRIIFFVAEDFPHEVLPAHATRESVTGWYLTEQTL